MAQLPLLIFRHRCAYMHTQFLELDFLWKLESGFLFKSKVSGDSGIPRPTRAVAEGSHLSAPGASSPVPVGPTSHIGLPLSFALSTESLKLFKPGCLRELFFFLSVQCELCAGSLNLCVSGIPSSPFHFHGSFEVCGGLHLCLTFSLVKTTVLRPSSLPHGDLHHREKAGGLQAWFGISVRWHGVYGLTWKFPLTTRRVSQQQWEPCEWLRHPGSASLGNPPSGLLLAQNKCSDKMRHVIIIARSLAQCFPRVMVQLREWFKGHGFEWGCSWIWNISKAIIINTASFFQWVSCKTITFSFPNATP